MALFNTLKQILTPYANKINLHSEEIEEIQGDVDKLKTDSTNAFDLNTKGETLIVQDWEYGSISSSTGMDEQDGVTKRARNIGYIPTANVCIYNSHISETYGLYICYYDENKNFVTRTAGVTNAVIQPDTQYPYMRIAVLIATDTSKEIDLQKINNEILISSIDNYVHDMMFDATEQNRLANMLVQKGINTTNYSFAYSATRVSVVMPIRALARTIIIPHTGYEIEVHTWSDYATNTNTFIKKSGYLRTSITIDADTLYTFTIRKTSNSEIAVSEGKNAFSIFSTFCTGLGLTEQYSTVKCYCHRGFTLGAPENTLPAFKLAKLYGFDAIETDVQKTSDGHYVMLHDRTVNRTSNGTGDVETMTLAELEALDFGSWYNASWAGTKIPTLEETLALCRDAGLCITLELKDTATFTETDIANIVSLVKNYRMESSVTYISLSVPYLTYAKTYSPCSNLLRVMPPIELTDDFVSATVPLKNNTNNVGISVNSAYVTAEAIQKLKSANLYMSTQIESLTDLRNMDDYMSMCSTDIVPVQKEIFRTKYLQSI